MMQLIYGTSNAAKVQHMRSLLSSLDVEIVGIGDLAVNLPEIDESGDDPMYNAIIKAKSFYSVLGKPVFSADTGLHIEGLPAALQPGVHVRRVNGKRLGDAEMTAYYADLAKQYGGKLTAQYRNALCFVVSESEIYTHYQSDIWGRKFLLVDKPHEKRVDGFPLDCLSVNIESGEYYYDKNTQDDIFESSGFVTFFREILGGQAAI